MKRRYVTVNSEIPITGHPNVGTAFVLAGRADKPPVRLDFEGKTGRLLLTRVRKHAGTVVAAHIGGRCVAAMEGTFHLAGAE